MKNGILIFTLHFLTLHAFAQTLDQNNTGNNPTRSLVDNIQSCAQTFKAGMSGTLAQVKVDITTENCPYPLICKIMDGAPGSTVLATEVVNIPINTSRSIYTITFTTPPALVSGNTYTIALYANCVSAPGQSIWWYKSVNGAYNNGQAYNMFVTTVQPEDTLNDFYFQTYMSVAQSVSENTGMQIKVAPNPASGYINVTGIPAGQTVQATVFDVTGNKVTQPAMMSN
ncbi:MAG: hypothetical protein Fur0041_11280 [Bacteroidia bacterium]